MGWRVVEFLIPNLQLAAPWSMLMTRALAQHELFQMACGGWHGLMGIPYEGDQNAAGHKFPHILHRKA